MKVIGLCGGSGSGKGAVALLLREYDIPSIDADEVYHSIVSRRSECTEELSREFGSDILNADGSLNRERLRVLVFADESRERLARLNAVSHRHILAAVTRMIDGYRADGEELVLFDAPLLFESGFDKSCDLVIAVIADEKTRISRIVERDGISEAAARKRISAQLSEEFLRNHSDFLIENNGTLDELKVEVDRVYKLIK